MLIMCRVLSLVYLGFMSSTKTMGQGACSSAVLFDVFNKEFNKADKTYLLIRELSGHAPNLELFLQRIALN